MHRARVLARARALPPAFLKEIARPDLSNRETHAAIAGMIVLRMVDRWVAGGCRAMDVEGARKAVEEMDAGNAARDTLLRVLNVIGGQTAAASDAVTEGLLTYAQLLYRDGRWHLAIAVFDAIIEYASIPSSPKQVFLAYIKKAQAQRTVGSIRDAIVTTTKARALATQAGDPSWIVQVQLSFATHAIVQGELTGAETMLVDAWNEAPDNLPHMFRARILNGRGLVAGLRGEHDHAIHYCHEALAYGPEPVERDRILQNIGEAFRALGYPSAARDTFLILSCTAQEHEVQFAALLSLMLIAAEDGKLKSFEAHRRRVDRPDMPPALRIDYLQHYSLAARILGDEPESTRAASDAVALAAKHGIDLARFTPVRASQTSEHGQNMIALPQPLAEIANEMRALREATSPTS